MKDFSKIYNQARDIIFRKVTSCELCKMADTQCDYHKKAMVKSSELYKRVKTLYDRQDCVEAIEENLKKMLDHAKEV